MNFLQRFDDFIEYLVYGDTMNSPEMLPNAPQAPVSVVPPQPVPSSTPLLFDTPKNAYHAVRVLCDTEGLDITEKNLICACIFQESRFEIGAINHNKNAKGVILSTDYSLCQVNDYYHIGVGKDFPSVRYVLENPEKVVEWMITMYKHGLLKQWVSYSSGAFKQWLQPNSPMWGLRS